MSNQNDSHQHLDIKAHDSDDDDEASTQTTEVIQPPQSIIHLIQFTARYVALEMYGINTEMMIRKQNLHTTTHDFLKSSDPYHAFYKLKLSEFRSRYSASVKNVDASHRQSQFLRLPQLLLFDIPQHMTREEFDTVKLTAHFVAWYGIDFWVSLSQRGISQLEFLKQTNRWFQCFYKLVIAFQKVIKPPPSDVKQELKCNVDFMDTILDAFLLRLEWNYTEHFKWLEGGERSLIDWHDSVTKDFANKEEDQELLLPQMEPPLGSDSPLEEPDPNRQKFDESSLVPEDQFLAQHQGSSIIKVSVPEVNDGLIIEIKVQSLSENVASLKEKIAGEIQIPANKHKLSGKAGFLKNKKSLAHYNVGAGDILTLFL